MAWTVLDEAKVLADCPTDLRPDYDQWLVDYPDKAGRLAEITGGIVAEAGGVMVKTATRAGSSPRLGRAREPNK